MTRFLARELATAHWFNLDAARRDLGYQPRVPTSEGLRRLALGFQAGEEGRGEFDRINRINRIGMKIESLNS
jgi:hypothetical protein